MVSLLEELCWRIIINVLSYCDPIIVITQISNCSKYYYQICVKEDCLWSQFCQSYGFSTKLFKEMSWLSNFKYYAIHILPDRAVINNHYVKKCCHFQESLNLLLVSGVGDGREQILQYEEENTFMINIRSQFSHNTGLTKTQFTVEGREFHVISFYSHLLLTFPTFFPSFPISDSCRDVVVWTVDASRMINPLSFDISGQLANVIYNQRYYHYSRKCLHILLSSIAPWVPLIVIVTNQHYENALSNTEIVRELRLWKEHRMCESNHSLTVDGDYTHCNILPNLYIPFISTALIKSITFAIVYPILYYLFINK